MKPAGAGAETTSRISAGGAGVDGVFVVGGHGGEADGAEGDGVCGEKGIGAGPETAGVGDAEGAGGEQVAEDGDPVGFAAELEVEFAELVEREAVVKVRAPGPLSPGARMAPSARVAGPPTIPLPVRVAPPRISRGPVPVPLPVALTTASVPASTVVPPL